jgi:lipopolysaccharide export system permease protein
MRNLGIYIFRQLGLATLMTAAGLTFAIWLSQSLRLLDVIINRGLAVGVALKFIALLLPGLLALLLPIAVFISVMFVYNRLNADSELVVMRSIGISNFRLALPAIAFAVAATLAGYFLDLYLIPRAMREYHDIQAALAGDIAGVMVEAGVFTEVAPGMTFYAQSRDRHGVLAGIIVDDSRDRERRLIYTATRGAVTSSPEGPRAVLENGTYQETDKKTGRVSVLYFDHTSIGLATMMGHNTLQRQREIEELYLPELRAGMVDDPDPLRREAMKVELHRRFAEPLYTIALALIAAGALINGGAPRQGQNVQMMGATVGVSCLLTASFVLRSFVQRAVELAPAMYALPIIAMAIGLWLLLRRPTFQRRAVA